MNSRQQESIDNYYRFDKRIDEGTFGWVYKATHRVTGDEVAIKKMKQQFPDLQTALSLKEIRVLLELDHPNIIKIKDIIFID